MVRVHFPSPPRSTIPNEVLNSALKSSGTRTVSPEETIRRARPVAERYGVTRVSDITGLDRLRIPVTSAIVPRSGDFISVYNGKGRRREEAFAGAFMEAIERQSVLRAKPPLISASAAVLRKEARIVEPTELVTSLAGNWRDDRDYEWLEGFDLIGGDPTWVPAAAAGYCWKGLPGGSPFRRTTSHGMAAGNCIEEAVSQALCELVERDAWTLAELSNYWWPRALAENHLGRDPVNDFLDDFERSPCIDLTGIGGGIEHILGRFHRAGLRPIVRDISSDLGIPVVVAAVADNDVPGFSQAHMGVGSHPELSVAAARALTEVAQSRCGDIQAVREDIAQADGDGDFAGVAIHTRRTKAIDRRRWLHRPSSRTRSWREIAQRRNADILSDIELILGRFRDAGIRQAVVVDFSPPDSGLSVVRVLAPGMEMWIADHGRFGERATAHWRSLAANGTHA
jgi:ribosomal protein S12 methylthiotransferase accessory factor YcaO